MRALFLSAVAATVLIAAPASADVVTLTVTGTVTLATDQTRMFGPGNLVGDSYVATYVIDTSSASFSSGTTTIQGGPSYGTASPILSGTVAINGISRPVVTQGDGLITAKQDEFGSQLGVQASATGQNPDGTSFNDDSEIQIINSVPKNRSFTQLTTPYSYDVQPGDEVFADTSYSISDASGTPIIDTFVFADVSNISLTVQAAVPEPSTWAMLVFGFCGLGFLAHRRRHVRTFA